MAALGLQLLSPAAVIRKLTIVHPLSFLQRLSKILIVVSGLLSLDQPACLRKPKEGSCPEVLWELPLF